MKKRVLQLGSPHGLYGAERWILALIKYLDAAKIESWVASIKDEPDLEVQLCTEAEKLGFQTKQFVSYGKFNFSAVKQLRRFIRENDIDILHTHHYKTDIIGFLSTLGTTCKIVSTPHGWAHRPDLKLWAYEAFNILISPFFDAIVPLSKNLFESLSHIPGIKNRLHYIKNGVDVNEINDIAESVNEICSLKHEGAFIIGYIGRLVSGKGLDILLNAVAEYGEPHWKVDIIGD